MSQVSQEDLKNMSPEQIAELQRKNCIFCKIVSNEVPAKKIFENDKFIAVLDIFPAAKGHLVCYTKQHIPLVAMIPPDLMGEFSDFIKMASIKCLGAFSAGGTTIFIANGAVAGQNSPHALVHVVPRFNSDGVKLNPSSKVIDDVSYSKLKNKLLTALGQPLESSNDDVVDAEFEDIQGSEENNNGDSGSDKNGNDSYDEVAFNDVNKSNSAASGVSQKSSSKGVDLDKISKLFGG